MNVLAISWRNVWRNGRRSALTLLASAVGAMAILLFGGYVKDNELGLQTVTVRSHGHLQIVAKDFLDFGRSNPGYFSIRRYVQLVKNITNDDVLKPLLKLATPMLQVDGVAGNFRAGTASNFSGEGVVPSEYAEQFAWDGFGTGMRPGTTAMRDDLPDSGVV
ncbi:MAG: ABC transporter permease, partial [Myxococcota bacterium]